MKKPKSRRETYEQTMEIIGIGNAAVREAQVVNHCFGLPNIYSRNGRIIYEMSNGEILVKETSESSEISEKEKHNGTT